MVSKTLIKRVIDYMLQYDMYAEVSVTDAIMTSCEEEIAVIKQLKFKMDTKLKHLHYLVDKNPTPESVKGFLLIAQETSAFHFQTEKMIINFRQFMYKVNLRHQANDALGNLLDLGFEISQLKPRIHDNICNVKNMIVMAGDGSIPTVYRVI